MFDKRHFLSHAIILRLVCHKSNLYDPTPSHKELFGVKPLLQTPHPNITVHGQSRLPTLAVLLLSQPQSQGRIRRPSLGRSGRRAWGWTTLTRKANSWMSTIRAGCALAQDTANYGVCDKYWCIVGHLTLLLRPCCVPSPSAVGAQYKRMLAFNRASRDAQWTPLCHLVRVSMLQNGSHVL